MILTSQIYSGLPQSLESESLPRFDLTTAPVRRCEITGKFGALSSEGFWWACRKARLDPAVKVFLLTIDSGLSMWDVSHAFEALRKLSRAKLTLCYITNAIGSTLQLAGCCLAIFTSPNASIGGLNCWGNTPFDDDSLAALNGDSLRRLATLRPNANPRTLGQMLFNAVNGVAAAELGMVDELVASEQAMLSRFKFGAEVQR